MRANAPSIEHFILFFLTKKLYYVSLCEIFIYEPSIRIAASFQLVSEDNLADATGQPTEVTGDICDL